MRHPALLPILLALAAIAPVLPGCGSCDTNPAGKVPFKQGEANSGKGQQPPDHPHPFEPTVSQALPPGTTRVAVEGAPLSVATGAIRALLPLDVDQDGDRDALLVRSLEDGSATVEFARRDGDKFASIRSLGIVVGPNDDCQVSEASIRTVSPAYGVLSLARTCKATASAPEPPEHTLAILDLGANPRLLERITLLPEQGRTPGQVTLAIETRDVDGDGHEDVVLVASVMAPGDQVPAQVKLPWLDRPSGLARDRSEPDETLATLAGKARDALAKDPSSALAIAQRTLTLYGVLCREGGGPRLQFGDGAGLTCGRSAGAGLATAIEAAALARQGKFFDALETEDLMSEPGRAVTSADRKLVEKAWAQAKTPGTLTWRKVASLSPGARPSVHLPAVTFNGNDTLLLRGASPETIDLGSGKAAPAPDATGPGLVRDPSGQLAVVDIHRTCEGYVLSIVRAHDVVAGVVAGRPVAEPLLEAKAPPPDAQCPALPTSAQQDDGGWVVLGWAPQGVVAVHGAQVRVVPLTVDGRPAGDPQVLTPGTPPPAPLPSGQATPDAQAYVLGSPYGVLLRKLQGEGKTLLLRPDGWASGNGAPSDVAISPDGSRVALLRNGDVWVIQGLP